MIPAVFVGAFQDNLRIFLFYFILFFSFGFYIFQKSHLQIMENWILVDVYD